MKQETFNEEDAQQFLKVSRMTLWSLRHTGRLSFSKIGRRIIYERRDLEQLLDQTKQNKELITA